MRLRPRNIEQAWAAIQALKDPGQEAYFVDESTIRITHRMILEWYNTKSLIKSPKQLEVKEYRIIA